MQAAVKQEENRQKFLNPNRLKLAVVGQGRIEYIASVEVGTTIEDVVNPEFWGLVASDVRHAQGCPHIEVISDDHSFHADLLVVDSGATFVKVKVIHHVQWEEDTAPAEDEMKGYKVAHKGPVMKHCVIDAHGNIVSGSEGRTKLEAHQFLRDHLKALSL